MSALPTIPRISLTWLLVAQALVILPLLAHLPLWILALWLGCAGWRVQIFRMRAAFPNAWAKGGLIVLAVPSDDFAQELADAAAVKEYCAINFDLTLRMTEISHVKGAKAHPFYRWMAEAHGFRPGWNFNKVLLGGDGQPRGTWGAPVNPLSDRITGAIDAALG